MGAEMTDGLSEQYDASDPRAENNAHRDQVRKQREDADTVRRLLNHKNGRAWFHRQLTKCHIYDTPFVSGQPETTFFQMGQENIGKQMMMEAIYGCPELYMKMLAEAREEEQRTANVREEEEKKRQGEDETAVRTQGFDLPPPVGWPGGPAMPPGPMKQ